MLFTLKRLWLSLMCLGLAAWIAPRCSATTLLVTESGTFSSSTPVTLISAPNGTFSLSFHADSNPVVLNSSPDQFDVAYSDFSYTLNRGMNSTPVGSITFFDTAGLGLFSVCFVTSCPVLDASDLTLEFFGPQIYTGDVATPTLLTGSFINSGSNVSVSGTTYNFMSVADANVSAVSPEPSTLVLLGTGLLAAVGIARRRVA